MFSCTYEGLIRMDLLDKSFRDYFNNNFPGRTLLLSDTTMLTPEVLSVDP